LALETGATMELLGLYPELAGFQVVLKPELAATPEVG